MKIVLIGPIFPFKGGIAHHTSTLYQYLKKRGHSIIVLSFKRQYPKWLYPGKTGIDESIDFDEIEAEYIIDAFNPISWILSGRNILKYQPDFVLFQWWTTFWAIPFYVLCKYIKTKKIPIYFLIHNVIPHERFIWDNLLIKIALSVANGFVVQSKNQLLKLNNLINSECKVKYCPLPIYFQFANNSITKSEAKQLIGVKKDCKILLFFGIIRKYKGLINVIKALNILIHENHSYYLIIAGEFWEDKQKYENMIKSMNLQKYVQIIDKYIPNEDVNKYFKAADIFLAPYVGGTQSGAVKVAMNYGLPLIITPHLLDDLIENYQIDRQVIVVPPANENEIAKAVRNISINYTGKEISESAYKESWENLVHIIEELHASFS